MNINHIFTQERRKLLSKLTVFAVKRILGNDSRLCITNITANNHHGAVGGAAPERRRERNERNHHQTSL